jgi:hypothetical protein
MERDILARTYMRLIKHINSIYKVCHSALTKQPDMYTFT